MINFINNLYRVSTRDVEAFSIKAHPLMQLLMFLQAPIYALLFWFMGGSETSALAGFMFGSMATISTTVLQCKNNQPGKHCNFPTAVFIIKHIKTFLWFIGAFYTFSLITPATL